jgi:MarR family transcriptional regulator for hemolysin
MGDRRKSTGHVTNWAARLFARDMERRLKPLGVLPAQLPILLSLAEAEALTQKQLVEIAAVEQPSMVVNLKRMERDGLIERRADPSDGRSSRIRLTRLGRGKLEPVQAAIEDGNRRALAGFNAAERAQFLSYLLRVIANFNRDTLD